MAAPVATGAEPFQWLQPFPVFIDERLFWDFYLMLIETTASPRE